jgi:hypothetical protein
VFSFTARRPASWFVERYIVSVYWAFTTITTVGYGDITATNNEEYILCLICMLIGVGVFTTVAAMLHSQLETAQAGRFDAEKKISKLVSFLKQRMVDPELRNGEDHHLMRGGRRRRRKTPLFSSLLCFCLVCGGFFCFLENDPSLPRHVCQDRLGTKIRAIEQWRAAPFCAQRFVTST